MKLGLKKLCQLYHFLIFFLKDFFTAIIFLIPDHGHLNSSTWGRNLRGVDDHSHIIPRDLLLAFVCSVRTSNWHKDPASFCEMDQRCRSHHDIWKRSLVVSNEDGGRKFRFFLNRLKSFRVIEWCIAIDTGDKIKNGWLYPLNFSPYTRQHLYINFMDENYLVLRIRNAPWMLAFAFLKYFFYH